MRDPMPRAVQTIMFSMLLAAGCASAGNATDAGFEPSVDARTQPVPDASLPVDASSSIDGAVSTIDASIVDAAQGIDAGTVDGGGADAAPPSDAPGGVYSHTITIDGVNDFAAADTITTTSGDYTAYVSWDATHVYIGYAGADMDAADSKKWLMVFFDTDPGAGTGAVVGQQYNTQRPGMPTGFGAEYYFRWRSSNDFQDLQQYATSWQTVTTTISTFQNGEFVEIAILRSALGNPSKLGITSVMVNETGLSEGSYAGLYNGSFTDGYYDAATANIPLTYYLEADFASAAAPSDLTNRKP